MQVMEAPRTRCLRDEVLEAEQVAAGDHTAGLQYLTSLGLKAFAG